jgi:hypothetical protein
MSGWKAIAVVAALTGCAGVQTAQQRSFASGHWVGEVDRDGWTQAVALDIENDHGALRGQWRSVRDTPKQAIQNVDVQGDEVRFETDKLRFVGHVNGSWLSGTLTDKIAAAPVGELSAINTDRYSPASEWAPPELP